MKASLAFALAGALLIASPALVRAEDAGTPPQPAPQQAQPQARGDDFAAKKDAYVHDMHRQMDDWGRKLHDYSKTAKAKGQRAAGDADKDLRQAWDATKRASRRVAKAGENGWDQAKAAYDSAAARLKRAWDKHASQ